MEKSIEKIWKEAFIEEQSLIVPKINDIYNQKSKSVIEKIKRTYEVDTKTLIPLAILLAVGMSIFSEVIIGFYSAFLILCLYFFNKKLLNKFNTIDIKSDNLTYLICYRNIITNITKATKKLMLFAIPLAILSIFILAYITKEKSFLNKFINTDTTIIEVLGIGFIIAFVVSIISYTVYTISTKVLYATLISKLDDIIYELNSLQEKIN
jgi:hypothetical protein